MSDFSLDSLGLRVTGRPSKNLTFSETRQLEPDDLGLLAEPRGSEAPPVKKLRERHHALARVLASGVAPSEASLICNYSVSRISILLADSAFKELLSMYRDGAKERYFDGHQAMAELHLDAVEELRERLEDDAQSFSHGQLMELAKMTADRTGLGPTTKSEVDVKIGLADKLAAGRKRVAAMRDITPEEDT